MKIFSVLLTAALLSSCGLFGPRIEESRPPPVTTTNIVQLAYSCPPAPQVDNFIAYDLDWDVISRKELDAVILELSIDLFGENFDEDEVGELLALVAIFNKVIGDFIFQPDDEVLWALNAEDYANSGKNISGVVAAIKQFKVVIVHYKNCISNSEEIILNQNIGEEP